MGECGKKKKEFLDKECWKKSTTSAPDGYLALLCELTTMGKMHKIYCGGVYAYTYTYTQESTHTHIRDEHF